MEVKKPKGKKYRKKIRKGHQEKEARGVEILQMQNEQVAKENVEILLQKLVGTKVSFPEVSKHGDLKLGVFYSATIQIGEEPEQHNILILAIMRLNSRIDVTYQVRCLNNFVGEIENNETLEALGYREGYGANPILTILYPNMMGHSMTPMSHFSWYGKEDILISNFVECPEAHEIIPISLRLKLPFVFSGKLDGKKFDGLAVLK